MSIHLYNQTFENVQEIQNETCSSTNVFFNLRSYSIDRLYKAYLACKTKAQVTKWQSIQMIDPRGPHGAPTKKDDIFSAQGV